MYFEVLEEYCVVGDLVLLDLLEMVVDSEKFFGWVKVFKELVEYYVDEEEKDMFL